MLTRGRVQRLDWFVEEPWLGDRVSFRRSLWRKATVGPWVGHRRRIVSGLESSGRWGAFGLMALGAISILVALSQGSLVHPWWPLLLGWVGCLAILRGFLGKDSPRGSAFCQAFREGAHDGRV